MKEKSIVAVCIRGACAEDGTGKEAETPAEKVALGEFSLLSRGNKEEFGWPKGTASLWSWELPFITFE